MFNNNLVQNKRNVIAYSLQEMQTSLIKVNNIHSALDILAVALIKAVAFMFLNRSVRMFRKYCLLFIAICNAVLLFSYIIITNRPVKVCSAIRHVNFEASLHACLSLRVGFFA